MERMDKKMDKKGWGLLFLIIGIIILLISIFTDSIGLGGYPGIGMKQTIGIIIGLVIAIIGYILRRR